MTTNQEQIQALQQLLRSAHQDVMEAIDGIVELEIRQVPVPDEWTVAQLMAHIAEIQYFWMEKAVLITQEDDPNIITRRDVENDRHAAAVEDHARDSLDELIRGLAAANESAFGATGRIATGDLGILGHRGESNPIAVEGVIRYLAFHVEEHADQITESRRLINES